MSSTKIENQIFQDWFTAPSTELKQLFVQARILTEKTFYDKFKRKSDGIISKDIEIIPIFRLKVDEIIGE